MHVHHFRRPLGCVGDEGTHDVGAVGGQDGVGGSHLVKLGEELSFHVEDFQNRFNDKVRVPGGLFQVLGEGNVLAGRFGLLSHLALFHPPREIGIGKFLGLFQNLRDDVGAGRFVPVNGAKEGDLMSHVSGANHTDFLDVINAHRKPPQRIALSDQLMSFDPLLKAER